MGFWDTVSEYWHVITAAAATLDIVVVLAVIPWILSLKRESTSAIAWILLVILLPFFGPLFFYLFGYQSVTRPLQRKKAHRARFRSQTSLVPSIEVDSAEPIDEPGHEGLARIATSLGATPPLAGNQVTFYHSGPPAFADMFNDIRAAKHHIHLEFFIFHEDDLGKQVLQLLAEKRNAGVQVRLLTDGIGARKFRGRSVVEAGCEVESFLPVSLLRRRLQVNMRNHRKIVVIDGKIAYTGGLNVGDEYVGKNERFGFWRDTFLRIEGPAVEPLQRVFIEDWDFAACKTISEEVYFPKAMTPGDVVAQVIASGPDQEYKSIREIYLAAIMRAQERIWIMTPYYVPDQAIRDGLAMAALSGRDVKLLLPKIADHWTPHFAAQYYFNDLLAMGVKIHLYTGGFLHSKVVIVDGKWASVGTANLDNRSLLLNFEVNCLFHTQRAVAELEQAFQQDLEQSIRLTAKVFDKRQMTVKLLENVCRLFAPVL